MRRASWRRVAALALALGLVAPVAHAEDPCREPLVASTELLASDPGSGVGGTGAEPGSGVGGTGLDPGSGVGGTGLEPGSGTGLEPGSGVGGTGLQLYGTVTALGSICVNGLRVVYEPDVAVQVDGRTADAEALAVGQVVWVDAVQRDDATRARRIEVWHALVGRIDARAPDGATLRLGGRSVEVLAETRIAGDRDHALAAGRSVAVSGLWRDGDHVVATRIDPAPEAEARVGPRLAELVARASPGDRLLVEGYLGERAGEGVRLGDVRIDTGDTAPERAARPGDRVRAAARLTPERVLRVQPVERPDVRPPAVERPEKPERPPRIERPETIERPEVFDRPEVAPRLDTVR